MIVVARIQNVAHGFQRPRKRVSTSPNRRATELPFSAQARGRSSPLNCSRGCNCPEFPSATRDNRRRDRSARAEQFLRALRPQDAFFPRRKSPSTKARVRSQSESRVRNPAPRASLEARVRFQAAWPQGRNSRDPYRSSRNCNAGNASAAARDPECASGGRHGAIARHGPDRLRFAGCRASAAPSGRREDTRFLIRPGLRDNFPACPAAIRTICRAMPQGYARASVRASGQPVHSCGTCGYSKPARRVSRPAPGGEAPRVQKSSPGGSAMVTIRGIMTSVL